MSKTVADFQQSKQYVEVDPTKIEITEPLDSAPKKGGNYKFHNPRGRKGKESGFSPEHMQELYDSILKKGLQQPVMCRLLENGKIQLIAGERRLRCILRILKNEKETYSVSKKKKLHPSVVYATIPCRLIEETECSDEDALSYAMDENDSSAPLTASDHVHIVECLVACGKTPKEIEELLNKNAAWVNHYINFRSKLPKAAFKALMSGDIPPFTATKILEYPEDRREIIWETAANLLQVEFEKKKEKLNEVVEETRAQLEIAEANLAVAEDADLGCEYDVDKAKKSVNRANSKHEEAVEKLDKLENEPPTMTGSLVSDAAESVSAIPTTPRALNKKKIQQYYIEPLWNRIENEDFEDKKTKKRFPKDLLELAMTVADAISRQETDVFKVIRGHLVEIGEWQGK